MSTPLADTFTLEHVSNIAVTVRSGVYFIYQAAFSSPTEYHKVRNKNNYFHVKIVDSID